MALVDTGLQYYPPRILQGNGFDSSIAGGSLTYDSTADRVGYVGKTTLASDVMTKIHWRTGNVTTGCDVDARVETVSNGRPSGTLWDGSGTNQVVTVANGDDNVWKTATLTNGATITRTQEFALAFIVNSGTPAGSLFTTGPTPLSGTNGQFPITLQDTGGGTYAGIASNAELCAILEWATAGVVPTRGLTPINNSGTLTVFQSGTNPNERAAKLVVPKKCRCIGVAVPIFNAAINGTCTLSLWPSSSTTDGDALGQGTVDTDSLLNSSQDGYAEVYFSNVTLDAGTTVYIGLRNDTATNVSALSLPTVTVTNAINAFVKPATYHLATRNWSGGSAGAWTDVTANLAPYHLIIDQDDDGAGGASSGGGMRVIGS